MYDGTGNLLDNSGALEEGLRGLELLDQEGLRLSLLEAGKISHKSRGTNGWRVPAGHVRSNRLRN